MLEILQWVIIGVVALIAIYRSNINVRDEQVDEYFATSFDAKLKELLGNHGREIMRKAADHINYDIRNEPRFKDLISRAGKELTEETKQSILNRLYPILLEAMKSELAKEEFLDSVVERIKRKQV